MPTFLLFPSAVKAHPESLAVCALLGSALLVVSCVSQRVEHDAPGPATGVVREAPTIPPSRSVASVSDAGMPLSVATASEPTSPVTEAPNRALELSFEDPYPVDARPRAASALQAAADDEELARWNVGGTTDARYVSSQASFHPGTRVVVDVSRYPLHHTGRTATNARSTSVDRVQAQARSKGYWPFRLCFEAGQREKKGTGGETRIRFTLNPRGEVTSVKLLGSELRNPSTSACLLSELRQLRFAARPKRLDALASIRIWPGDAELPPVSDPQPGAIETTSGFNPEATLRRVTARQQELSACFEAARQADPRLWGRLAFAVVLEVDGSVHRVSEVESHFPNAAASRCAAAAVSAITFPSVNGKPFSFVLAMRLPPSSAQRAPGDTAEAATEPASAAPDAGASD